MPGQEQWIVVLADAVRHAVPTREKLIPPIVRAGEELLHGRPEGIEPLSGKLGDALARLDRRGLRGPSSQNLRRHSEDPNPSEGILPTVKRCTRRCHVCRLSEWSWAPRGGHGESRSPARGRQPDHSALDRCEPAAEPADDALQSRICCSNPQRSQGRARGSAAVEAASAAPSRRQPTSLYPVAVPLASSAQARM